MKGMSMQYDQFAGQVQHRAHLPSGGEALEAIRATLETLADRLVPDEVKDLASQLPREIGIFLNASGANKAKRFSLKEFYQRVSARENVDLAKAVHHAKAVISVL